MGGERRLVVGKHSGRAVIKHALEAEGVGVDDALLDECLRRVRTYAVAHGGEIAPADLRVIYAEVAGAVAGTAS